MANLIRSAKSSSDWSCNDLVAYNITVVAQSPEDFFCTNTEPSLDDIDPSLINSAVYADNVDESTFHYLTFLDLATKAAQKTWIDEFARQTLLILGFEERELVMITGLPIPLTICGDDRRTAQTDVCLLSRQSTILLIVQGDKTLFNGSDPEPQVIAEAIAAYRYNNMKRQTGGLPTLDTMIIPCITMVGTRPTFYLVPVSRALSTAVETGQYPETPTKVTNCVTILGPNRRFSEGMESPEYRRLAFQRFIAFKSLAKEYWQTFHV
ncbi:hypothetical protein BGW80DRAFT_1562443 [Lactifluus volemus]|nr:hypothetical protein BGW80DRAFT_1562443 [Lactifluus volemus]